MTSVSNAIFQMKSTEYSMVFPLRKIFKNLILLLLTKYYPVYFVTHMKTSDSMKWFNFFLASLEFMKFLTKNVKFPYLVIQIEVQIVKNLQGTRKNKFCSLITSYHRNKITWLKYYGTNSTDSRSKNIQWFCWSNYH